MDLTKLEKKWLEMTGVNPDIALAHSVKITQWGDGFQVTARVAVFLSAAEFADTITDKAEIF